MWSKVSPKRQEIIEKIFAIDKSLGIQSIVLTFYQERNHFYITCSMVLAHLAESHHDEKPSCRKVILPNLQIKPT